MRMKIKKVFAQPKYHSQKQLSFVIICLNLTVSSFQQQVKIYQT
jgi:hypothetical protein